MAFLICQISFFNIGGVWIENQVFAADWDTPTQNEFFVQKATERNEKLSFVNKVVYVLIYPLLVLAGKLADNSFVYWEDFWFDTVLWHLWIITRNLANYALWFIFLYKVFEFLWNWQKTEDIKNILKSSLIAWVWIQASWFIMASLIDVSTILTYWVWWLPYSVLKNFDDKGENPYILKTIVDLDVNDINNVDMFLTNVWNWTTSWNFYISECRTFTYKNWDDSEELILAPQRIYYSAWNSGGSTGSIFKTDQFRCNLRGQVYYFNDLYGEIDSKFVSCTTFSGCELAQEEYKSTLGKSEAEILSKEKNEVESFIISAKILQVGNAHLTGWIGSGLWSIMYTGDDHRWLDVGNKWTWEWQTSRLQDLMDGHSYVWVFTALYSSLMNAWKDIIPQDVWTFPDLLNVALWLWHSLAIGIPLIIVAVVFMIRICVLWLAIVLSPFIVLLSSFKWIGKVFGLDEGNGWWKILKSLFDYKELLRIIFAPAIICFAISISTVFVTILLGLNALEIASPDILWWLIKLKIENISLNIWKLIISILWIAITWFLVWAAVESSALWKIKVIQDMKNLAWTALWSIPIVPVPTKDWNLTLIWANSAFGLNWQKWIVSTISDDITNTFDTESTKAIEQFMNPEKAKEEALKKRAAAYESKIVSLGVADIVWDWREKEIEIWEWSNKSKVKFNGLNDEQKTSVINKINDIKDENVRAAFGSVSSVTIWNEVYNFNQKEKKYVSGSASTTK